MPLGERLVSRSTASHFSPPHPLHASLVHSCGIAGDPSDVHRYMLLTSHDVILLRSYASALSPCRDMIDLCTPADPVLIDSASFDAPASSIDAAAPLRRHYLTASLVPLDPFVPSCLTFVDHVNDDGSIGRVYADGYVEGFAHSMMESPSSSFSSSSLPSSSPSSSSVPVLPRHSILSSHAGVRRSSSTSLSPPPRRAPRFGFPPLSPRPAPGTLPASSPLRSPAASPTQSLGFYDDDFESAMHRMNSLCLDVEAAMAAAPIDFVSLPAEFLPTLVDVRRTRALHLVHSKPSPFAAVGFSLLDDCIHLFSRAAAVQAVVLRHNDQLGTSSHLRLSMNVASMIASRHVTPDILRGVYITLGQAIGDARLDAAAGVAPSTHPTLVARATRHAAEADALEQEEQVRVGVDPFFATSRFAAFPSIPSFPVSRA